MKITLKEKSSMISKAIIFQIAMSIFGVMLASSIQAFGNTVLVIAGVFSVLFYFALIGAALNEDGLRDNIKVTHGRAVEDKLLGFKYIAVSYIPTLAITVVYVILKLCGLNNDITTLINALIRLFLSGMYLSLDRAIFAMGDTLNAFSLNGWSFLIYQVFSIVICGLFYIIGLKGINLIPVKKEED